MKLKSIFTAACFIFCLSMIACHTKTNAGNTWDSTGKHTMPGDSTINKIDAAASSSAVDTVKMMNDTSQQ